MIVGTTTQSGTEGLVVLAPPRWGGFRLYGGYDPGQRWRAAGARNVKDEAGDWCAAVPDVATLRACEAARGPLTYHPGAAAQIEGATASIVASRAADADVDVPAPEGLAYMPFQRAGIAYALARESTLIADEMGLGKTIQAIGVLNARPWRTCLVICPASLRLNWRNELRRWLVEPRRIAVLDDKTPVPPVEAEIVIAGYERARIPKTRASLMARTWDVLIVDEAHRVKNPTALQTRTVLGKRGKKGRVGAPDTPPEEGLIARATRKLFLTGTPILNRPKEIQPLLGAIAPTEFGDAWRFFLRYCGAHQEVIRGVGVHWNLDGATHLDELQQRMRATCMVRRLKRDVLTELPPKRRQIVVLPGNGASDAVQRERDAWDAVESTLDGLRWAADQAHALGDDEAYRAAVAALQEAARVAFGEISKIRHEVAVAKAPAVVEHVQGLLEDGGASKIVVMAHHHDVIRILAEGLAEHGVVTLTGETPMEAREEAVRRFQAEPGVRVFIGSIMAAGVGLTLTAASTVVFAELDWVPANVTQAEDRCHRIGQTDPVLVQHLVLDGSLDARMADLLVEKQAIADAALDVVPEERIPVLPQAQALRAGETEEDRQARAPRPRAYKVPTPEQAAAALLAVRMLAGVCDGARRLDGYGFNKADTATGHKLAGLSSLTPGQAWLAARFAVKYQRQLPAELVETLRPLAGARKETP